MGIVIIFFLAILSSIPASSIAMLIKHFNQKELSKQILLQALIISLTLYASIFIFFFIKGNIWAFDPIFKQGIYLILIPFIVSIPLRFIQSPKTKHLSKVLLASIVFSTILCILLIKPFYSLLELCGIKLHY